MTIKSACFTGPRAGKMPYSETSFQYKKLEEALRQEIKRLIWTGVSELYTGGQTGIDTLAALLVINIRDELKATVNLNLVLPYKSIKSGFTDSEKDNFDFILKNANSLICICEDYTTYCYRKRNQYMVDKSDYLIAVSNEEKPHSGIYMAMNMARKKGIEITTINPLNLAIIREQLVMMKYCLW